MDMDGLALQDRAACNQLWHDGQTLIADPRRTMTGGKIDPFSVPERNAGIVGVAKSAGRTGDCGEHRLQVEFGAADHPEHVADRGLIFERLLKLTRPRLYFFEQPGVLDGDNGLIGEGGDQFNLLLRKELYFASPQCDRPEWCTFAQKRNDEHCAMSKLSGDYAAL